MKSRRAVMAAAALALLLSLLDTNVVTATATSIAASFGPAATARVPWLVTAYALAETVTQPVYGKLADRHGVKPVLLAALSLFAAGSVLCALAPTMTALIAFRVVQGLGAAGLLSVTFVLLGQLRSDIDIDDDAGAGNAAGGVLLACGIVAGPLLGGTIVAHVSWRWVFWIDVPIAAMVLLVMALCLRLHTPRTSGRIDWCAAAALAVTALAIQLICALAGHTFAWRSGWTLLLAATALSGTAAFWRRQLHDPQPFVPVHLTRNSTLRLLTILQLTAGLGLAAAFYVTLDLQLVRGDTPFRSGLHLIAMAIGAIAGAVAGYVLVKRGHAPRDLLILGTAASALSLAGLAVCAGNCPIELLWVTLAVNGFGSGISLGNELTLIQDAVPRHALGIATTGVRFVETLGTTVGATAFGLTFAGLAAHTPVTALRAIFAIGAAVLTLAVIAATRLPKTSSQTAPADSPTCTTLTGAGHSATDPSYTPVHPDSPSRVTRPRA